MGNHSFLLILFAYYSYSRVLQESQKQPTEAAVLIDWHRSKVHQLKFLGAHFDKADEGYKTA